MKVLHINQSDIDGGAAIAGYRLHQGLLNQAIDSRLLVGIAKTDSNRVEQSPRDFRIENQLSRLTNQLGLNYINHVGSFKIAKHRFYTEADILNFHNLHTGYFSYLAIPALTATKPAVFTLHDMWSFTGHCAYSYNCDRWKTGCGNCPDLKTYPSVKRDNTNLEWKLKNWVYNRSNLTIVSPSKWLADQARQSILNCFPVHHIPYGIDTDIYQPLDPKPCRDALGISGDKKVLLFSADNLKDSRKGGDLLIKALQSLPKSLKQNCVLLTFGRTTTQSEAEIGMPLVQLGYISSDRLKSIAYSAADLFLFPTRADNLPLVLQESMACGTPMVSFKIGGVPDLVRPSVTGYLAQPEDTEDFKNGIIQLLEDHVLHHQMKLNCRQIVLMEYSLNLQAHRYIEVYKQVLN